jgi:predicted metal-dependent phosphoesterase TrpH
MFLDLHTHSVSSDDSRATVEQYVKWVGVLRRRGFRVDGFVLTEHRKFDFDKDYSELSHSGQVTILKGSELDTDAGHFLVYGVTEELVSRVDFGRVGLDAVALMDAAAETGAIVVPAHPGRLGIGLHVYIDKSVEPDSLHVVEHLNGSNRPGEEERATELIDRFGLLGTGGSDAHMVSAIGSCLTRFDSPVHDERDLVRELRGDAFSAVRLKDAAVDPEAGRDSE